MVSGFWQKLNKPIFGLAPLYDVTDAAFRHIIAKYSKFGGRYINNGTKENLPAESARGGAGGPGVMFTEFVSADGLVNPQGRKRLMHHLVFDETQRPIVAQIFGKNPENFYQAAQFLKSLKFDGIDINLGCPDKNIMKQGACAALFKNPKLAQEIIQAAQEGGKDLPISVKIRIGDVKIDWQAWLTALIAAEPSAITIHLRTRKEMSKVAAHWELMPQIMRFVIEKYGPGRPLILGNGDIKDLDDARKKIKTSGADGVLLGRAIFGNPWLFKSPRNQNPSPSPLIPLPPGERGGGEGKEKLDVMIEHAYLFEKLFSGIKSFEIMKKHFKAYCAGFGAKELREKLMLAKTAREVENIVRSEQSSQNLLR